MLSNEINDVPVGRRNEILKYVNHECIIDVLPFRFMVVLYVKSTFGNKTFYISVVRPDTDGVVLAGSVQGPSAAAES